MDAERIMKLKLWLAGSWAVDANKDWSGNTLEYIAELEATAERAKAMARYLNTHDNRLHDAAMAASREHLHTEE
jgi:FKBP-type peptidyl-prolyl cis-trans isomerase 2